MDIQHIEGGSFNTGRDLSPLRYDCDVRESWGPVGGP